MPSLLSHGASVFADSSEGLPYFVASHVKQGVCGRILIPTGIYILSLSSIKVSKYTNMLQFITIHFCNDIFLLRFIQIMNKVLVVGFFLSFIRVKH